jgi:hypothetical protein
MGNDPVNNVDEDGGGIEDDLLDDGPGPNIISTQSITNFYQDKIVPLGYCIFCGSASNAETLSNVYVTAAKAPALSFIDNIKIATNITNYLIWDRWTGILAPTGQQVLIRAGGVERGVISGLTFNLVPSTPIFSENYSQDDMDAYNGSVLAGQISTALWNGPHISTNLGFQLVPINGEPIRFNLAPSLPSYQVNATSQSSNSNNTPASRDYGNTPFQEIPSGTAVRQKNVLNDWNNFLGSNQTNIDPRDGLVDPDRIWSADGQRSIRFGDHETGNSNPNRWHYHKETWSPNFILNVRQRVQR